LTATGAPIQFPKSLNKRCHDQLPRRG